jgi:hypothetical protein
MPDDRLLRDRLRFLEIDQEVVGNLRAAGRDATPVIQALCKAMLLDLDLVIYCYLEAKDQQMVAMLERATPSPRRWWKSANAQVNSRPETDFTFTRVAISLEHLPG